MYKFLFFMINFLPFKSLRAELRNILKICKIKQNNSIKINKLAIWGWWQGNNLGDNWIKDSLTRLFPEAVFIDTDDWNIFKYKFVIIGGGGLFQEDVIYPWKNLPSNLNYGMLGLGAEFEHISKESIKLADNSKFFFVRDKHSLKCMHIYNKINSYDITFSFPLEWVDEIDTNKLYFVWRDTSIFDSPKYKKFRDYGEYEQTLEKIEQIINAEFDEIKNDDFQTKKSNIEERILGCGFVITGRYHGIVAAIQKGLPCIALDIYPKNRAIMKECGLEEYCVKLSETDKIVPLIQKAKKDVHSIREKMLSYRSIAIKQINKDIRYAKKQIEKSFEDFSPLSGLHYGSYWMKQNDIVNVMSDDLSKLCNLTRIDLKLYGKRVSKRVKVHIKLDNGQLNYIDTEALIKDVKKYKPDFVILNSAGLTLYDDGFKYLRDNNIISVGLEMSDPDVYPTNGKLYAPKFDIFYTNSKYSLQNQYNKDLVNIKLLPFAASTSHHYPIDTAKFYDVVVIGHSRPEREALINKIKDKYSLGLYGCGWKHNALGVVNGKAQVEAINSGKIYLSFSGTCAGFQNIKIGLFEAIACKMCVITQYFPEIEDYFIPGEEILCYKNENELIDLLNYYLSDEQEIEKVRVRAYERFLREHTYITRWENVLEDIHNMKLEKRGSINEPAFK